jgi:hypothetical protein
MAVAVPLVIAIAIALTVADRTVADAVAPASPAAGPDTVDTYVHSLRADLSRGKTQIICDVMHLSADEAALFWPIYQEYETELFELGDKRVELIRQFGDAQRAGKLAPDEASALTDGYFEFETARVALTKRYCDQISKEMSPVRAAQFTQIEHRVGTVVDLIIAANVPLIRTSDHGARAERRPQDGTPPTSHEASAR